MLGLDSHSSDRLSRFRPWLAFALVVLATFLLYVLLPFQVQVMDSSFAPAVAASLVYEGDLTLTEFSHWKDKALQEELVWHEGEAYWFRPVAGAVLSITGRQERRGREITDIETISLVAGP